MSRWIFDRREGASSCEAAPRGSIGQLLEVAKATTHPDKLRLALVALMQRQMGRACVPHIEGPHVYLEDLRLTRGGCGWVVARRTRTGLYDRCKVDLEGALRVMLGVEG